MKGKSSCTSIAITTITITITHSLTHVNRVHYRSYIHQFCSVGSSQRGSIHDILPHINSTTTHYASENQRLLAENEYIKHSQDRLMTEFQDTLDKFGNTLVTNISTTNSRAGPPASYTQWKLIYDMLDEQARRIENFVDMQTAQSRMLGTVIGGTYSIPTLCIVLPKVNKTVW